MIGESGHLIHLTLICGVPTLSAVALQVSAHGNVAHTGGIDAIVAGLDGYVWVGYHKGRLERYTAGGMLAWWKVRVTHLFSTSPVLSRPASKTRMNRS